MSKWALFGELFSVTLTFSHTHSCEPLKDGRDEQDIIEIVKM